MDQIRFTTESFSIHLDRTPYFSRSVEQALFREKPQTVIQGKRTLWLAHGLLYAGIFGYWITQKRHHKNI